MQIFRFDADSGVPIDLYASVDATFNRILKSEQPLTVGAIHVAPQGIVGYHEAHENQLFLVVRGSGWVTGDDRKRAYIGAGMAAFWTAGESHESGTETGMTAIVIEGEGVNPNAMTEVKRDNE